jgi:3-ketosteroid 9alpha-monooxygenase subunit B
MRVLAPEGRFVLTGTDRPLLLFAGGSGITPIISLLKTTLVTTERKARLVYANRDQRSIIFHAELEELLRRFEGRFTVVHRLDDRDGFIKERDVAPLVAGLEDGEAYVCGPAEFMETIELGLRAAGVKEDRVHFERFLSLPDPKPHEEHVASAAEVAGAPETIDVTLRGKKHTIPFVAGKTLLRAALDAGLDAPYSCEEGFCGTCVAQLEEGQVKMDANDALTKVEIKRGLVLACQSHPLTKRCAIQFVD